MIRNVINRPLSFLLITLFSITIGCKIDAGKSQVSFTSDTIHQNQAYLEPIIPGAENLSEYVPLLQDKKVALVVNHTSRVGTTHLLDTLLSLEINISKLFTPEHGFKGSAGAGDPVKDAQIQKKKTIPVISLYGDKKIPDENDLADVDVVVFDIQDVGVRFYTYISTLHYVMEACAESNIPIILLDRPNPNGHYVDGPVLQPAYKSFVGMHAIPVVYGMTIGELAQMINSEAMLKNGIACDLYVVKNKNYTHLTHYDLPVKPSPNLPDNISILLYPSLCFFEGTPISIGRGTEKPFSRLGHPSFKQMKFTFTPMPNTGASKPKLEGELCYGMDFSDIPISNLRGSGKLNLEWLLQAYRLWEDQEPFFNSNGWFDKLAGTSLLREQIEKGLSEEQIRQSWQPQLESFKKVRIKYLLYPDFE